MDETNYPVNVPFLVYALNAFTCVILCFKLPLPSAGSKVDIRSRGTAVLRYGAMFGMAFLAFGTGCDNARLFAGSFPHTWPSGVFHLRNATQANELIEQGELPHASASMQVVSWFCFFAHECLGASFALPGFYFILVSCSVPKTSSWACCRWPATEFWIVNMSFVGYGVSFAVSVVGVVGFAMYTATKQVLLFNPSLDHWSLGPSDHSPVGLVGVFFASFLWVVCGCVVLYQHKVYWFLITQIVCILGQGAAVTARDYTPIVSNLFEQASVWSLILLAWSLEALLRRMGSDRRLIQRR